MSTSAPGQGQGGASDQPPAPNEVFDCAPRSAPNARVQRAGGWRRGVRIAAILGVAGLLCAVGLGLFAFPDLGSRAPTPGDEAARRKFQAWNEEDRKILSSYDLSRKPVRIPIRHAMALIAEQAARSTSEAMSSLAGPVLGREEAVLASAPHVPPPITRSYRSRVVVRLTTSEFVGHLADGVEYRFWAFNKTVPGPLIRVRQGDLVEVRLSNDASSRMPHNIDLHACLGPGGGAAASYTPPGQTSVFSFTALKPGLYVYHCAVPPMPLHIANGMYGLILVEPEGGLPRVDREYYIMQSEFFTKGAYGEHGLQDFDYAKALAEDPTYVVFNGGVGTMAEDKALTANVGETVRMFVGNAGPGLVSSFHVIGEILDRVYGGDGVRVVDEDVQTTVIPPGSAEIVEFMTRVPGMYEFIDHSAFRALKGAVGHLVVRGPEDRLLFAGRVPEGIYSQEAICRTPDVSEAKSPIVAAAGGEAIFARSCAACHQPQGQGIPNVFPPLARSDFLASHKETAIEFVLFGHAGPIVVNGKTYNNVMPPQPLSDEEVANVLSYVRSHFGNDSPPVDVEEVRKARASKSYQ